MSKTKHINNKLERSDQKANTNTSAQMKTSHNLKQDTSSKKNSSQTVEIKNKTNERKQCQKQNIFNNKLERSHQKANINTTGKMKISHNLKKILLQKRIVHKQLKSKTKPVFSRESPVMTSSLNETFGGNSLIFVGNPLLWHHLLMKLLGIP